MVAAYRHRPPHPPATMAILRRLIVDEPRSVLDAGTGLGGLARELAPDCERVEAVDFSEGMVEAARSLPGGDDPRIRWICSSVECADLCGPYALIAAADSLSWFDLEIVTPRFAELLTENGVLAVIERSAEVGLREDDIIHRYSLNREYVSWNPVKALEEAEMFERLGQQDTGPVPWTPTVDEYIEYRHSQNGFSRDRMARKQAADFDAALRGRITRQVGDGTVRIENGRLQGHVSGSVVWGRPKVGPGIGRRGGWEREPSVPPSGGRCWPATRPPHASRPTAGTCGRDRRTNDVTLYCQSGAAPPEWCCAGRDPRSTRHNRIGEVRVAPALQDSGRSCPGGRHLIS